MTLFLLFQFYRCFQEISFYTYILIKSYNTLPVKHFVSVFERFCLKMAIYSIFFIKYI